MLILTKYGAALKAGYKRLQCETKLCMQLRIACLLVVFFSLILGFMHWRWVSGLEAEYAKGFQAGKTAEAQAAEQAIRKVSDAYDAAIQAIEYKHIKELEVLNTQKDKEDNRVKHWENYTGHGGNATQCLNAQQLQELRESTNRTR